MKKSFFFFAFLGIIASTGFAQEQEKSDLPPRHIIKTNPFAILSGPIPLTAEFRLGYEHVIAPHRSYLFCASYLNQSPIDWLTKIRSPQTIESGFRGQMMYRWYLSKKSYAPDGFFVGPHISYSYLQVSEQLADKPIKQLEFLNYMSANLLSGYQVLIVHVFSIELFSGLGVNRRISRFRNSTRANIDVDRYGFQFTFGSNLGIAF